MQRGHDQTWREKNMSNPQLWWSNYNCIICDDKAIGINFGVRTCAPCKAFFRRNAGRKEILSMQCPSRNQLSQTCSQIRQCSSCRLQRCFQMGMREDLVRTDEEKQRYQQLIQFNRQQRRQQQLISKIIVPTPPILEETDRIHLSNLIQAYDNYCLKQYVERRRYLIESSNFSNTEIPAQLDYHTKTIVNNMCSLITFLSSIPTIQSIDRTYLCQHNIRPLIFLNIHELDQLCFSDPSEIAYENSTMKFICGEDLYDEWIKMRERTEQLLINDPIVIRLLLLILFLSSPLNCYYDRSFTDISSARKVLISTIQQSYIDLLWKYLLHRYHYENTIHILFNLNRIYLSIQRLSQQINAQIRTRDDLRCLHQSFHRTVTNS